MLNIQMVLEEDAIVLCWRTYGYYIHLNKCEQTMDQTPTNALLSTCSTLALELDYKTNTIGKSFGVWKVSNVCNLG